MSETIRTNGGDIATFLYAWSELRGKLGMSRAPEKARTGNLLLDWYQRYFDQLYFVEGITGKASRDAGELNAFLREHGHAPMFGKFDRTSIGAVSIYDMLVKWLFGPGQIVDIVTDAGIKPGFALDKRGAHVYQVGRYRDQYLLRLETTSVTTVWILVGGGLTLDHSADLVVYAEGKMSEYLADRPREAPFSGVQIPMVDTGIIEANADWILGTPLYVSETETYYVSNARQLTRFRMNEEGAHSEVVSTVVMRLAVPMPPLVVNQPFLVWTTTSGADSLPVGVHKIGYDAMKRPETL